MYFLNTRIIIHTLWNFYKLAKLCVIGTAIPFQETPANPRKQLVIQDSSAPLIRNFLRCVSGCPHEPAEVGVDLVAAVGVVAEGGVAVVVGVEVVGRVAAVERGVPPGQGLVVPCLWPGLDPLSGSPFPDLASISL